jgi:GNAT superfamily N-acetyltransferase
VQQAKSRIAALLIKALAATCYSRLVLFERLLDEPIWRPDDGFGFELDELAPTDADEYARLVPGSDPSDVQAHLSAGHYGYCARHDQRLVAVAWLQTGEVEVPYLRGKVRLKSDETLAGGLFVEPGLRGRNVPMLVGLRVLARLREAGHRRTLGLVLPENTAGFSPAGKLGYRRIGVVHGVGLGRRRRIITVLDRELAWRCWKWPERAA